MENEAQNPNEIFDVVDEHDRVIGVETRANVHAKNLFHRAVHIFVFLKNGEILLQQRSLKKDTAPGLFSTSCAGHVDSGENYENAALRELREELGISAQESDLEPLFSQKPSAANGFEFVRVYALKNFAGTPAPNPAEILCLKAFPRERLISEIEKNPKIFAPSFISVWSDFLKKENEIRGNAARAGTLGNDENAEFFEVKLPASTKIVPVKIVRSARCRRMILRISSRGNVEIAVPNSQKKYFEEARLFALKNLDWIDKQFEKNAKKPAEIPQKTFIEYVKENPKISVGNDTKTLEISSAPAASFFVFQENSDVVPVLLFGEDLDAELRKICREIAEKTLPQRVRELAEKVGVSVRKISVRAQKSRWGSCTVEGDISLNFLMIFLPPEVRDHVILHELAHRKVMNHSPKFWEILNSWDAKTALHDDALSKRWNKVLMRF